MSHAFWKHYARLISSAIAVLALVLAGLLIPAGGASAGITPADGPSSVSGSSTALSHAVHSFGVTAAVRLYAVRSGDVLGSIARRHCGRADDWSGIYLASRKIIGKNPNLILPGQLLTLNCAHPYVALPRPPAPPPAPVVLTRNAAPAQAAAVPAAAVSSPGGGTLSYSQLEGLWERAGGPSWAAPRAAEIAECESGGNQFAQNPSGASGYWQILGQVVSGWIFDPMVNAENAVAKFHAGTPSTGPDTFGQWVCT